VLRIWDVFPGFQILIFVHPGSRIPDPKTATKEKSKTMCHPTVPFSVATNITKNLKLFYFWAREEKTLRRIYKEYIELFTITWNPGSGIRKKTYSRSRGQKGTESRIRNTEYNDN
jgi:hypothetical protein